MKTIIYNVIYLTGLVISYIYPLSMSKKLGSIKSIIYTARVSRSFKKLGKHTRIYNDCSLAGEQYIEIGEHTYIARHGIITCWDRYMGDEFTPSITIGNHCSIGEYCHITSINSITIGNGVLTGRWVTITDNSHGFSSFEESEVQPAKRKLYSKGPVVIEDNVWIGDKATVLSGVHIGYGSIIGAGTVVTRDIPANCVAGGNPAKIIKIIKYE